MGSVAEAVAVRAPESAPERASAATRPMRAKLPALGARLGGRYRLEKVIGRGACAIVFRARDETLGATVALKLLLRDGEMQTEAARALQLSLRDEALSAMRLSHPNVLRVYNYEREDPWEFLVMEWVDGEDLVTRCVAREGRRLSADETVRIAFDCLAALSHAHALGVTHNDIKPGNILLTREGVTKLCDFGLARLRATTRSRPGGPVAGTPAFMSPELIRGEPVDARSDLYCLAATLFAVGNGAPPFGSGAQALVHHLRSAPPPSRFLPPAIDAVLRRGIAKSPDDRYASADQMAEALRRAIAPEEPQPLVIEVEWDEPDPPPSQPPPLPVRPGWARVPAFTLQSAYGGTYAVAPFHISQTAVTNEEYLEFVEKTGATPPFHWLRGRPPQERMRHPVVGITLDEARRYAAWRGLRLPTSIEWEAAARGPQGLRFPWGAAFDSARCHGPTNEHPDTLPVDAMPEGASANGCLQMLGNVWEWTVNDPRQPPPPSGSSWAFGGSYQHPCEADGAIARTSVTHSKSYQYLGFRCVSDEEAP